MTSHSHQAGQACPATQAKDELVQKLSVLSSWLARELTQTASCLLDPMSRRETIFFRVQDHSDVGSAESLLKRLGAVEPPRQSFPGELIYRGNPVVVVAQPGIQLHNATLPKP